MDMDGLSLARRLFAQKPPPANGSAFGATKGWEGADDQFWELIEIDEAGHPREENNTTWAEIAEKAMITGVSMKEAARAAELQGLKLLVAQHQEDLVDLKEENLKMKEELADLKSNYDQLKLKAISDVCSEASSWVKVHQDAEDSMLQSASSAFSVETNGPRCFMLDALFKTPDGTFLSGTRLHLGLN